MMLQEKWQFATRKFNSMIEKVRERFHIREYVLPTDFCGMNMVNKVTQYSREKHQNWFGDVEKRRMTPMQEDIVLHAFRDALNRLGSQDLNVERYNELVDRSVYLM